MPSFSELPGLRVTVDRVAYMPHLEAPTDKPFPFVYFITIHNDSEETVTIKGRKWVVTDAVGGTVVVEGDGVAEGAFIGLTDDGRGVLVRIPRFEMKTPESE